MVLTVPARLRRGLGIRPGDRFAVYETYDPFHDSVAILYVPVRASSGPGRPERAVPASPRGRGPGGSAGRGPAGPDGGNAL